MKLLVVLLFVGAVMAQRREGTATPMSVNDNHQEEGPTDESDKESEKESSGGVHKSLRAWGLNTKEVWREWKTFNDRRFIFMRFPLSWSMAQGVCIHFGGGLATIHTPEEAAFVSKLAQGREAWIGFSDAQNEDFWLWLNSEPITYTQWCPGEPNNANGEHCAAINFTSDQCWNDENCNNKFPFVCEIKKNNLKGIHIYNPNLVFQSILMIHCVTFLMEMSLRCWEYFKVWHLTYLSPWEQVTGQICSQ
ncbi:hypothetical protein NL108_017330 [Boleophthalmus pectinirostris]|nr:hypothetical protein NL108_017330 [Boleophthalmus pectinirostris]